jgi:hypothetical protein
MTEPCIATVRRVPARGQCAVRARQGAMTASIGEEAMRETEVGGSATARPVFVDPSGRRALWARVGGGLVAAVVVGYLVLIGASLIGAPWVPSLRLPGVRGLAGPAAPVVSAPNRPDRVVTLPPVATSTPPPELAPSRPGSATAAGLGVTVAASSMSGAPTAGSTHPAAAVAVTTPTVSSPPPTIPSETAPGQRRGSGNSQSTPGVTAPGRLRH